MKFGLKEIQEFAENHEDQRVRILYQKLVQTRTKNAQWAEALAKIEKELKQLKTTNPYHPHQPSWMQTPSTPIEWNSSTTGPTDSKTNNIPNTQPPPSSLQQAYLYIDTLHKLTPHDNTDNNNTPKSIPQILTIEQRHILTLAQEIQRLQTWNNRWKDQSKKLLASIDTTHHPFEKDQFPEPTTPDQQDIQAIAQDIANNDHSTNGSIEVDGI